MESNMANETKKRVNPIKWEVMYDGSIRGYCALGERKFHPREASLECNSVATLKGWKSTFEDAGAKSTDKITGKPPTLEERWSAIVEIMTHYADKSVVVWGRKAAGGERAGGDAGLTLMALMRVKGVDLAGAEAIIKKMMDKHNVERKDVLANLGKNEAIIRAIADIKAERAAASRVNAADMLDELDDEDDGEDGDADEGDEPEEEAPM
jgi:hypothetical protein